MKKILMENIDDKKLNVMTLWFNLYVNTLDEVVIDDGNKTYFREDGDVFGMILINKTMLYCWVNWKLWNKLSDMFSLEYDETKSFITKWVEDTYHLKGIDIYDSSPMDMMISQKDINKNK